MPQANITQYVLNNEGEVELKVLFRNLKRYTLEIILSAFIFTVAFAIYAYLQQDIYQATASFEINFEAVDPRASTGPINTTGQTQSLDNEIQVLQSTMLARKALNHIDLNTIYMTKKNFKVTELFNDSPFIVKTGFVNPMLKGILFEITLLSDNKFILEGDPDPSPLIRTIYELIGEEYKGLQPFRLEAEFGQTITTPLFELTINKLAKLENEVYGFVFLSNRNQIGYIRSCIEALPSGGSPDSTVLNVVVTNNNAQRTFAITDAISKAYLEQKLERKLSVANEAIKYIDNQIQDLTQQLQKSGKKLESFKSSNALVDLSGDIRMTAENLSKYQADLQALSIEEDVLRNLKFHLNNNEKLQGLTLGSLQVVDKSLVNNMENLQNAIFERKNLLNEYTEIHPRVIALTQSIETLRQNIDFIIENNLASIIKRKRTIQNFIDDYQKKLSAIPEQEQKLATLTTLYNVNEKFYSYLLEKRSELVISRATAFQKTRMINEPWLSRVPIKPKRNLITIVGFVLGLIVGVFYALLRISMREVIESVADIESQTSIPVFGSLPKLTKRDKRIYLEALRILRTYIRQLPGSKDHRVILISSTVSGEGKSTTSKMLGAMIANNQNSIVVVDTDLRRGLLHQSFKVANQDMGLSTFLRGENTLDEIIIHNENGLDFIPRGRCPENPAELIDSAKMAQMVQTLKDRYDYVILDAPPLGIVSDSLTLLSMVDLVLILARNKVTTKQNIKNVDKLLKRYNVEKAGIVFNGASSKDESSYGYGYGSYVKESKNYYV